MKSCTLTILILNLFSAGNPETLNRLVGSCQLTFSKGISNIDSEYHRFNYKPRKVIRDCDFPYL